MYIMSLTLVDIIQIWSEPMVTDLTGLEIAVKGECEPLQVLLQPYAVHIPGQILVETGVKHQFRVSADSGVW